MALSLSRFIAKPLMVSKRKSSQTFNISIIECEEEENGYLIKFIVASSSNINKHYKCNVWVLTKDSINMSTICKLSCECPSFIYEFEAILNKFDALYGEPHSIRLPKKAKPIFICKHLHGVIIMLLKYNNVQTIKNNIRRI
jgi:hypothetical protein